MPRIRMQKKNSHNNGDKVLPVVQKNNAKAGRSAGVLGRGRSKKEGLMKRKWVKDLLLAIALLFAVVTWGFAGWELGEMAGLNRARQECAQDLTKMLEAEKVSCPVCGEKSGQATQN